MDVRIYLPKVNWNSGKFPPRGGKWSVAYREKNSSLHYLSPIPRHISSNGTVAQPVTVSRTCINWGHTRYETTKESGKWSPECCSLWVGFLWYVGVGSVCTYPVLRLLGHEETRVVQESPCATITPIILSPVINSFLFCPLVCSAKKPAYPRRVVVVVVGNEDRKSTQVTPRIMKESSVDSLLVTRFIEREYHMMMPQEITVRRGNSVKVLISSR